jgi:hypothetical protein
MPFSHAMQRGKQAQSNFRRLIQNGMVSFSSFPFVSLSSTVKNSSLLAEWQFLYHVAESFDTCTSRGIRI